MRSIAGNVAPIAAVAGSSSQNVPKNATIHCQTGEGWTPVDRRTHALNGDMANTSSRPHSDDDELASGVPAHGARLLSIREPSNHAPIETPPKNAATTARTAAASWPSHSAHCCVHTTW